MISRLVPIRPSMQLSREVWLHPEVESQLSPEQPDVEMNELAGRLRRRLDDFARGSEITVGNRSDKGCDAKRLDPQRDEVWELRLRETPSVRIFHRFIERDAILATSADTTASLFSEEWRTRFKTIWPIWRQQIRTCKARWRAIFHPYEPHTGDRLDDYLSRSIDRGFGS